MKRLFLPLLFLFASCGPERTTNSVGVSREPISVRGWIAGVEGSEATNTFRTVETEAARRMALFQQTNVWVDNAPYVSGGVAENGSFILLDVPPGNVTIVFSTPNIPAARLVLQNIPGNADVIVPGVILKKDSVAFADPAAVKVRMAAHVRKAVPAGRFATIAGLRVPVMNTPMAAMVDRRDYPNPPYAGAPLATVK
jgi:hypothetical protein